MIQDQNTRVMLCEKVFNPLPHNMISNFSRWKAPNNDKTKHDTNDSKFFDMIENTSEKGENAGYQHFIFFP